MKAYTEERISFETYSTLKNSDNGSNSIEKKNKTKLEYDNLRSISFTYFLKESSLFSFNYLMERSTSLISVLFFRYTEQTELTEIIGYSIIILFSFSCFYMDHQESIGIILGPFYSKRDEFNYYLNLYRMVILNLFYFLITGVPVMFYLKNILNFMSVDEQIFNNMFDCSFYLFLISSPLLMIVNFLKGIMNARQLQKHYL